MDSIGSSALGVLSLAFSPDAALAHETAFVSNYVSIGARANDRLQKTVSDMVSSGGQLRGKARSSMLEWGTGGFELRGERFKSGSRLIDTGGEGGPWRRTYAADVSFWENATIEIAFEAGARLERTKRGWAGGPLLTCPTNSVARMTYVGVQISDTSSIRLIGFDIGGWSGDATGQCVSRIANGEHAARMRAAIEIARFGFHPGSARWEPRLALRLERGRTAARPHISATLSWKSRL